MLVCRVVVSRVVRNKCGGGCWLSFRVLVFAGGPARLTWSVLSQEMLFKKHMKAPECDQAPCGTGMKYLDPSYHRVAGIVHHAEFGTPQGNSMGTNQVLARRCWRERGLRSGRGLSERRRCPGVAGAHAPRSRTTVRILAN